MTSRRGMATAYIYFCNKLAKEIAKNYQITFNGFLALLGLRYLNFDCLRQTITND